MHLAGKRTYCTYIRKDDFHVYLEHGAPRELEHGAPRELEH